MDRSTTWPWTWMWPPGLKHAVCFNYLPLESTWCVLLTITNVVLLSPQFYPRSMLHKKIIITALQYVSILTTSGQSPDDTCIWNPCSVFWLPTNSGAAQQQQPVSWLCAAWLCMRNFYLLGKSRIQNHPNIIRLFCADVFFLTNSMFPLESPFIQEPFAIFAIVCTNCSFS